MRIAFVAFAILSALCAPLAAATQAVDKSSCTTSTSVADRPPDDPNASSFASSNGTWYANETRTVYLSGNVDFISDRRLLGSARRRRRCAASVRRPHSLAFFSHHLRWRADARRF